MYRDDSRYHNAPSFVDSKTGITYTAPRKIAKPSAIIEHTIVAGDTLDGLADYYYNDNRLWWRIVDANLEFFNGSDLINPDRIGQILLIPRKDG